MGAPRLLRTREAVFDFLASVAEAPFLALDTETSGLDPHSHRVVLIQVGTGDRQALIDAACVPKEAIQAIFHPGRLVVLHNASFDLKMLWSTFGEDIALGEGKVADTLLSEMVIRNGRQSDVAMRGFALSTLAMRYAGMELDKSIRQGFYGIESVHELSEAELRYAERDVEATWKVFAEQLVLLERDGLLRAATIEGAATLGFAQMEFHGAPLDVDGWSRLVGEAKAEKQEARKKLDREFWTVADRDLFGGTTLNYDSDQEVLDALRALGVVLTSTRKEALLASGHSAAEALAEYREQQKLVSTYGDAFLAHVHPKTGRIHPRFASMGAVTGRASCKEPNLQNIPSGSAFRACFKAPRGRKLITADYVGAELRILAEASKDPLFIDTLGSGGDLHALVATRMFKKSVSKSEHPELRARAKAINFGLAYGMGAQGLANQIGVPREEAESLLQAYFRSFPRVKDYLNRSAQGALRIGRAEAMSGRKFWMTDMRRDGKDEGVQLRVAKNMPIQGANADMTKVAMARIPSTLKARELDAFLVNMVHDELVVEASVGDAEAAKEVVVQEMMAAGAKFVGVVSMEVEAKIDDSWAK